jgi:tagaturonate reductase
MALHGMGTLPTLSRDLIARGALDGKPEVGVPTAALMELPERAIQFGTGAFLRAFIGSFIDDANRRGAFNGRIVAVSSTGSGRDDAINNQDGLYTLAAGWRERGTPRRTVRILASTSRALAADADWPRVLECARDPRIVVVFSNTTEVGITLDVADVHAPSMRRSFPAKLTAYLFERARTFDFDPAHAPVVIPCELIDDNGAQLLRIVETLASRWRLDARFGEWLGRVTFCNTLVDRIVTTPASNSAETERPDHALGFHDDLLTLTEHYRLLAIQGNEALRARLRFATDEAQGILIAPDIAPYRVRKLRILNGAHTICAPLGLLAGCETVGDMMAHPRVSAFQRRAMFDEIAPTLSVPGATEFAREVMDRFANPFIRHALWDITLHGASKMSVRVVPTIVEYVERQRRIPQTLAFGFAMYLLFSRGELQDARRRAGQRVPTDTSGDRIRAAWASVEPSHMSALAAFVGRICADRSLWGYDLSAIPGFADAVTEHLTRAHVEGVDSALGAVVADVATATSAVLP